MAYYDYFEPSRPRAARGGIKAQTRRGKFGSNWWAKRWIQVLESFNMGARLTRGRSYARKGQVLSIEVAKGTVEARVQGSLPTPYEVAVGVTALSPEEWKKVGKVLSSQILFAAQLLAGEMPAEIEKAFQEAGASLFPTRLGDLKTRCSCPDSSNPCKHIAAVYYLLGEEFDRDPFLLFKLRGMSREELVKLIGESGAKPVPGKAAEGAAVESGEPLPPEQTPEPLLTETGRFWEGAPLPSDLLGNVRLPPVDAALPRRLGSFPFWRGETPFFDALEPVYHSASKRGMEVMEG